MSFPGLLRGGNIFSDEDIRKVREANDLVELFAERSVMRQRGKDFWCCCPFHQEKTPSCKVDSVSQTWHCFGCGEGGDIISYVRKLDDVDFVDAVRFWLVGQTSSLLSLLKLPKPIALRLD